MEDDFAQKIYLEQLSNYGKVNKEDLSFFGNRKIKIERLNWQKRIKNLQNSSLTK